MIGQRLKNARAKSALSLRDVEEELETCFGSSDWQVRARRDDAELQGSHALAVVFDVTESYLLSSSAITLEGVEFRKNCITNKREEASVEASVLSAVERYLQVESLLAATSECWVPPARRSESTRWPMRTRLRDRCACSGSLGSTRSRFLSEFLEEKGIKVICQPLEAAVSGLTVQVQRPGDGRVPVVVTNTGINGERTALHARARTRAPGSRRRRAIDVKRRLYRFAGAFLMPAESLFAEVGQRRTAMSLGELFTLKRVFGVSVQAIAYRCRDLDILSAKASAHLFATFTKLGWRSRLTLNLSSWILRYRCASSACVSGR